MKILGKIVYRNTVLIAELETIDGKWNYQGLCQKRIKEFIDVWMGLIRRIEKEAIVEKVEQSFVHARFIFMEHSYV